MAKTKNTSCCALQSAFVQAGTDFFKAFCDPTRMQILLLLGNATEPCTVSGIAEHCTVDFSVVSRHLSQLKRAGLVSTQKMGREVFYSLDSQHIARLFRTCADAIEQCCPKP